MFLYYYTISGIIMSSLCFIMYEKIKRKFPVLEMIPKSLFTLINFFVGFLNLPIVIVYCINILRLKIEIYFIKRQNERLRKYNEALSVMT